MKRIVLVILVLALAITAFCKKKKTFNEYNSGETLVLKMNEEFVISLTNPGDCGYSFLPVVYDTSALRLIAHTHISPKKRPNIRAGDFGHDEWKLKAIHKGVTSNLAIKIQRQWEADKGETITKFAATVKTE